MGKIPRNADAIPCLQNNRRGCTYIFEFLFRDRKRHHPGVGPIIYKQNLCVVCGRQFIVICGSAKSTRDFNGVRVKQKCTHVATNSRQINITSKDQGLRSGDFREPTIPTVNPTPRGDCACESRGSIRPDNDVATIPSARRISVDCGVRPDDCGAGIVFWSVTLEIAANQRRTTTRPTGDVNQRGFDDSHPVAEHANRPTLGPRHVGHTTKQYGPCLVAPIKTGRIQEDRTSIFTNNITRRIQLGGIANSNAAVIGR